MSERGGLSPRKRGHQHHPKHQGTRRSNVPADEVIAVLRADLPAAHQELLFGGVFEPNNNHIEPLINHPEDASCMIDDDASRNTILDEIMLPGSGIDSKTNHNNNNLESTECLIDPIMEAVLAAPKPEPLSPQPVLKKSRKSKSTRSPSIPDVLGSNNSLNHSSTTSSTKSRSSASGDPAKPRKKRSTPREERPPIEGAADDPLMDIENDPELAEWSKLRCTSERTEVVAEREHRRQNRRCADYPGLAFGRSIFSSDTMMKFSIIKNELHNIMNTQLKRVRGSRCWRKSDEGSKLKIMRVRRESHHFWSGIGNCFVVFFGY